MPARARVVKCSVCVSTDCQYVSRSPHLDIEETWIDVLPGSASAISYVWGEFNRQKRLLGHYQDGTQAFMELGEDWDVSEFVVALHNACNDPEYGFGHSQVWVDQLSIRQADKTEVAKGLQQIARIFQEFPVLVLLQGGKCTCWTDVLDMVHSGKMTSYRPVFLLEFCLNQLGFLLWNSRVWTRSELYGARRVRARWVSSPVTCPSIVRTRAHPDVEGAGAYFEPSIMRQISLSARLYLERQLAWLESGPEHPFEDRQRQAGVALREFTSVQAGAAVDDLLTWRIGRDASSTVALTDTRIFDLWKFLDGERVTRTSPKIYETHEFLTILHNQIPRQLTATKSRDYVIAMWSFCPGYRLPEHQASMGMVELLADAIRQFESSSGCMLSVAPVGLFQTAGISFRWCPESYVQREAIQEISDVYGALFPHPLAYLQKSDDIRILLTNDEQRRNTTLISCADMLHSMAFDEAMDWLNEFCQMRGSTFAEYCFVNIRKFYSNPTPHPSLHTLRNLLIYLQRSNWSRKKPEISIEPPASWKALLQDLCCVVLGLPLHTASLHDLQILIDTKDAFTARIGLFRSDVSLNEKSFTVRMFIAPHGSPGELQYEVVPLLDDVERETPQYRTVGVWIPHTRGDEIDDPAQAFVDPDGTDGCLV